MHELNQWCKHWLKIFKFKTLVFFWNPIFIFRFLCKWLNNKLGKISKLISSKKNRTIPAVSVFWELPFLAFLFFQVKETICTTYFTISNWKFGALVILEETIIKFAADLKWHRSFQSCWYLPKAKVQNRNICSVSFWEQPLFAFLFFQVKENYFMF